MFTIPYHKVVVLVIIERRVNHHYRTLPPTDVDFEDERRLQLAGDGARHDADTDLQSKTFSIKLPYTQVDPYSNLALTSLRYASKLSEETKSHFPANSAAIAVEGEGEVGEKPASRAK